MEDRADDAVNTILSYTNYTTKIERIGRSVLNNGQKDQTL